tara:strand:- start:430 stop:585 length:156 start_codon:yes stop_codon:yes gene_type:complete
MKIMDRYKVIWGIKDYGYMGIWLIVTHISLFPYFLISLSPLYLVFYDFVNE